MSGSRELSQRQRFDRIWQEYRVQEGPAARVAQHEEGRARFLRLLNDYVRAAAPRTIVEVGCGSAIDLCLLQSLVPSVRAMGLDVSFPGLQVAQTSAEHLHVPLHLCQGDAFTIPLRSGMAGLVFSQGVLEHFDDPRRALAEQARVLAPGGVLVVSVPQTFTGYTLHKHKAIRAGTWLWGWEGQFSSRTLCSLGREVGLEVERVFGYQYWLSWAEPTWVLRDLVGKVERRLPAVLSKWVKPVSRAYDRFWNRVEESYGHAFLLNVAAVFRTKGSRR